MVFGHKSLIQVWRCCIRLVYIPVLTGVSGYRAMNRETPMNPMKCWLLAAVALSAVAAPGVVLAQPSPADEQVDEIVVTGQRSLRVLRRDAGLATENFYELLNERLNNDEFKVTCRSERNAGSLITRRVCRTAYQSSEIARQGQEAFNSMGEDDDGNLLFSGTFYDPSPVVMQKNAEFRNAVLQAVNSDPELNQAVHRLIALREAVLSAESGGRRQSD